MSKVDQIRALREARAARTNPVAKATKGKAGTAGGKAPVRRSTAGTGLRVGKAGAVQSATSEFMDVTAGETAPNSKLKRGRPKITEPRPWEIQGKSRRTYYRHMKQERDQRKAAKRGKDGH